MLKKDTIVITGAAGFIGSCMASCLIEAGYTNLVLVDDFSKINKVNNLKRISSATKVHRDQLEEWLLQHQQKIAFILHLGARTDTTEQDFELLKKLNLNYTKMLWEICIEKEIPLIYASSAATYGDGEFGYKDDESLIPKLKPLNPYGVSKNEFDIWALEQKRHPPYWIGLKFFNVYGPNEYHKGRMASVIFHSFNQILKCGKSQLFKSHNPKYSDGGQLRDFIYVKDILKVISWLMKKTAPNGIYNLGTGKARTFKDLSTVVFNSLGVPININYIDTPIDIREKYQYFTEADMSKLKAAGYKEEFYTLEEGIDDYVKNYLLQALYF